MSSADQCALSPNGELLDVSKIKFYRDPDDNTPLETVCTRKQSSRLTYPDNAEMIKRKANETDDARPSVRVRRHSPSPARMDVDGQSGEDDDDDMPDLQPVSDSEDEGDDDVDTDIEDLNATAKKTRPKAELTKDIQPIFKEGEILDPVTGTLTQRASAMAAASWHLIGVGPTLAMAFARRCTGVAHFLCFIVSVGT
ncbi:hypothetical protein B0H19DRAFT_1277474 [Mycena capillaripes]|nr:hypothetical protein B0H19DRAFT_1277474 [Mycena capillaripes]